MLLVPYLPGGSYMLKGMTFGVAAWLLMMVMPMANVGLFGMMAPVMTLMLHLIFGAVLGAAYGMDAKKMMLAYMN